MQHLTKLMIALGGLAALAIITATTASAATQPNETLTGHVVYGQHGHKWDAYAHETFTGITKAQAAKVTVDKAKQAFVFHRASGTTVKFYKNVAEYRSKAGDFAVRVRWHTANPLRFYRIIDEHHVRLHDFTLRVRVMKASMV